MHQNDQHFERDVVIEKKQTVENNTTNKAIFNIDHQQVAINPTLPATNEVLRSNPFAQIIF